MGENPKIGSKELVNVIDDSYKELCGYEPLETCFHVLMKFKLYQNSTLALFLSKLSREDDKNKRIDIYKQLDTYVAELPKEIILNINKYSYMYGMNKLLFDHMTDFASTIITNISDKHEYAFTVLLNKAIRKGIHIDRHRILEHFVSKEYNTLLSILLSSLEWTDKDDVDVLIEQFKTAFRKCSTSMSIIIIDCVTFSLEDIRKIYEYIHPTGGDKLREILFFKVYSKYKKLYGPHHMDYLYEHNISLAIRYIDKK